MASYDSNQSGYSRPHHQQQQQPPYPTTPQPPTQPQTYFPPIPEQQPVYSTSPTAPFYSSSPPQPQANHSRTYSTSSSSPQEPASGRRRTSSTSSYTSQRPAQQPIPIPNPQQYQHQYQPHASYPPPVTYAQQAPTYTRTPSHHSDHAHNPHAYADGEDKYEQDYGRLDEETERQYRKRCARERALERRPTLGDSLLSVVGRVGRAFGGSERR